MTHLFTLRASLWETFLNSAFFTDYDLLFIYDFSCSKFKMSIQKFGPIVVIFNNKEIILLRNIESQSGFYFTFLIIALKQKQAFKAFGSYRTQDNASQVILKEVYCSYRYCWMGFLCS